MYIYRAAFRIWFKGGAKPMVHLSVGICSSRKFFIYTLSEIAIFESNLFSLKSREEYPPPPCCMEIMKPWYMYICTVGRVLIASIFCLRIARFCTPRN